MSALEDLEARLAAAVGPDREVDERLFELVRGRKRNLSRFEQYQPSETLPAYTSNIDAAVELVPENAEWQTFYSAKSEYPAFAQIHIDFNGPPYPKSFSGSCAHMPIAVCLAAIRARIYLARREG